MSNAKPLALQLYSLRERIQDDFEGTVRHVADMGYLGVEPYGGMPGGLQNAADLFRELDLQVPNTHVTIPVDANKDEILATKEAYGLSRAAVSYLPTSDFETIDAIKAACERLNRAGEFAQSNGFSLGYHNHWWEYKMLDGQSTLDVMLSELDESVFLEIDTYWVQAGGMDAVETVIRAGSRAPLIHLKDGGLDVQGPMTAVGAGVMNVPAIVAAAEPSADWHIVEIDRCEGDMLECVRDSYTYLTENGLTRGRG